MIIATIGKRRSPYIVLALLFLVLTIVGLQLSSSAAQDAGVETRVASSLSGPSRVSELRDGVADAARALVFGAEADALRLLSSLPRPDVKQALSFLRQARFRSADLLRAECRSVLAGVDSGQELPEHLRERLLFRRALAAVNSSEAVTAFSTAVNQFQSGDSMGNWRLLGYLEELRVMAPTTRFEEQWAESVVTLVAACFAEESTLGSKRKQAITSLSSVPAPVTVACRVLATSGAAEVASLLTKLHGSEFRLPRFVALSIAESHLTQIQGETSQAVSGIGSWMRGLCSSYLDAQDRPVNSSEDELALVCATAGYFGEEFIQRLLAIAVTTRRGVRSTSCIFRTGCLYASPR